MNRRLWLALALGLGALAYANSLPGILFWDNEVLILNNVFLRSFRYLPQIFSTPVMAGGGEISNYYRPLPVVLLLLQYQAWGAAPWGFHAVNILVHLACGAIVFAWVRRLLKNDAAAFIASAVFLLHPVQNETVNYVDHVEGMLAFLFGMTALLTAESDRAWTSVAAWTACLLCKEDGAVFLPLMALQARFSGRQRPGALQRLRPHAAVFAVYAVLHVTILNFLKLPVLEFGAQRGAYAPLGLRLLTFAKVLATYLGILVWPAGLHFDRFMPPISSYIDARAWACVALDSCVFAGLWFAAPARPWARLGLLWFLVALGPTCGVIPFNNLLAEHFLYVSMAGLALAAAEFARIFLERARARARQMGVAAFCVLIAGWTARDLARNRDWQSPIRLYETTLEGNPSSYRAANNLGVEWFRRGDRPAARRAFEASARVKPDYAPALNNLGAVEEGEGRLAEAESWYRKAAAADPSYALAHKNLAGIALRLGRPSDAVASAQTALRLYPEYPDAWAILAAAAGQAGDAELARQAAAKALSLRRRP